MDEPTLLTSEEAFSAGQPLAARMRPSSLDEITGQQHLLGPGKVLRRLISSDTISSMIFWGPPGVGKTTLARVIALQTRARPSRPLAWARSAARWSRSTTTASAA